MTPTPRSDLLFSTLSTHLVCLENFLGQRFLVESQQMSPSETQRSGLRPFTCFPWHEGFWEFQSFGCFKTSYFENWYCTESWLLAVPPSESRGCGCFRWCCLLLACDFGPQIGSAEGGHSKLSLVLALPRSRWKDSLRFLSSALGYSISCSCLMISSRWSLFSCSSFTGYSYLSYAKRIQLLWSLAAGSIEVMSYRSLTISSELFSIVAIWSVS